MLPEGIPEILYKYRDWENVFHKKVLSDNEIYFPSPKEFNDPFDCAIPFTYNPADLTEENVFKKCLGLARGMHPKLNETQLHEIAYRAQRDGLIFDPHHLEKHNELRKEHFNRDFGILSLTAKRNNFLMWSHYGNCHRGFVVGFDTRKLFNQARGQVGPVIYAEDFPLFGLFDEAIEHFIKYAFHKAKIWEYEEEYRILLSIKHSRVVRLAPDTVREIVLGYNMDFKSKQEILSLAKAFPNVTVFDSIMHKKKYSIEVQPIM